MPASCRSAAARVVVVVALVVLVVLLLGVMGLACAAGGGKEQAGERPADSDTSRRERMRMVETQIVARGVDDPAVLEAMRKVPRHLFVPEPMRPYAHEDGPLRIGHGQTISQPYIVALMTSLLRPRKAMKVLEIGTGSGYQAAILAECVSEVYSIEIIPELGRSAAALLEEMGHGNVHVRIGDGFDGWPEHAPFDGIVVTAAPEEIPRPLLDQLADGGRLVIPVGVGSQDLVLVTRAGKGYRRETITPVRFVPMTGKAQDQP